jgi:thioredoxin-like negative regulator of GroEL
MYQEAIRLDPGLWWGRAALANDLLSVERDAEALDLLEQTLRVPGHDSSVEVAYAMAAIGAGATARARETLKETAEDEDDNLWTARWLLLLASGEHDLAEKLLQARENPAEERDPEIWTLQAQLLRVRRDSATLRRVLRVGMLRPEVAGLAGTIREEEALAAGDWKEAVAAIDELKPEETSYLDRIYAAWALRMSGDAQGAGERLAALETELAAAGDDSQNAALLAMTQHLAGKAPANAVLAAARRAGYRMVPHAWFILGAAREANGDAAGARSLYEKARQRALDFDVPYFMASARAEG